MRHLCIKCKTCAALLMVDNMPNITFAGVLNDTFHGRDVLFLISKTKWLTTILLSRLEESYGFDYK